VWDSNASFLAARKSARTSQVRHLEILSRNFLRDSRMAMPVMQDGRADYDGRDGGHERLLLDRREHNWSLGHRRLASCRSR
jgi:hypothetical protein